MSHASKLNFINNANTGTFASSLLATPRWQKLLAHTLQDIKIMKTLRSLAARFVWLSFLLLYTHCSVEESLNTAVVNCSIRLDGASAMEGKINVGNAYLHLTQFDLHAGAAGREATRFSHTIPAEEPPLMLTGADDRQPVSVFVTPGVYEPLLVTLHLFQDDYDLIIIDEENNNDDNGDNGQNDGHADGNNDHDDDKADDGDRDHDDDKDDDDRDRDDDKNDDDRDRNGDKDDDDRDRDDDKDDDDRDRDDDKDDDDRDRDDDKDDDDRDRDDDKDDDDRDRDDDKGDDDRDRDDDKGDDDRNKGKGKGKGKNNDKDKDKDDEDGDDDGRTGGNNTTNASVDFADFLLHAKPAIVLLGTYENGDQYFAIFLAIDNISTLSFTGTQNGSTAITLSNLQAAEILFDVDHWFSSITPDQMESATRQVYQEQEVVLIHKEFNKILYNAIVEKIEASGRLVFNTPVE